MKFLEGFSDIPFEEIIDLYASVGWDAYGQAPERLKKAFENSTYSLFCYEGSNLVGLARSISDDAYVHFLKDLIVKPSAQRKGYGTHLIQKCHERFSHVRIHVLLTEDTERQKEFYKTVGYHNVAELKSPKLNAFLKTDEIALE